MKSTTLLLLSIFTLIALTACEEGKLDTSSIPKITNPLAGHAEALEKAKNLEAEMKKALDDRMNAIDAQSN